MFIGMPVTLLIGPSAVVPAPPPFITKLDRIEVTHGDEGRSGFQLTFKAGRSDPLDDPLLRSPLLKVFNRVQVIVTFKLRPRVLMDGIITQQELDPGDEPGTASLTVTGEDVSVMMDQEEKIAEHPAQPDAAIVARLIGGYAHFGLAPVVVAPKVVDPPLPIERVPVQHGTDLGYIEELGARHGHVFYVEAGPAPGVNQAYWGPPKRIGLPQKALSVHLGTETNVRSMSFRHDALAPALVASSIQDARSNQKLSIKTFQSQRLPPLSSRPTLLAHRSRVRRVQLRAGGLKMAPAYGRAQAITDRSTDQVVTATGELDAQRYGDVLTARGTVGVRGAGHSYDGLYYVKRVSHKLRRGDYTQSFTLTRDGVGSTTPVVRP